MDSNQAREHFENSGLSYSVLDESDIFLLFYFLAIELKGFVMSPHVYAKKGNLKINQSKSKTVITSKGLITCEIEVQGPYFSNREAITFNESRFIGFAGWADDVNKQVFIDAFVKWVDHLTKQAD